MGLDPGLAAEKELDIPTPMNVPAVPQQNDFASEMTEQLAKERDDLKTATALGLTIPESLLLRADEVIQ